MTELLRTAALNSLGAAALAACVLLASGLLAKFNRPLRPATLHLLWLVVLAKLLTPPLVAFEFPNPFSRVVAAPHALAEADSVAAVPHSTLAFNMPLEATEELTPTAEPMDMAAGDREATAPRPVDAVDLTAPSPSPSQLEAPRESGADTTQTEPSATSQPLATRSLGAWLGAGWAAGAAFFFVTALWRIARFHRSVARAEPAPHQIQSLAADVAARLNVRRPLDVRVTNAALPPLVWPIGRAVLLLPQALIEALPAADLRMLILHEAAHLRRRDHLARWFALLAVGLYWWNPLAWWAARRARDAEEQACDAWAIDACVNSRRRGDQPSDTLPSDELREDIAHQYAAALWSAIELISPPQRPPQAALTLGDARRLKSRFHSIMHHTHTPRLSPTAFLAMLLLAAAVTLCGFGYATAQPPEADTQPTEANAPSNAEQKAQPGASQQPEPERADADTLGEETPIEADAPPTQSESAQSESAQPEAPQSEDDLLNVGPVQLTQNEQGDSATIEFTVDVPQGRRFAVWFGERSARPGAQGYHVFENERPQPVEMRIELSRRDDDRNGGPGGPLLLSTAKMLNYRVETEGAYPSGLSTIVDLPLGKLGADEKQLQVLPPESPLRASPRGVRLLLIAAADQAAETPEAIEELPLRGELIVSLVPNPEPQAPDANQAIARAWDRLQHGIGAAEIHYQRFNYGASGLRPLTPLEVRHAIEEAGLNERPEKALDVIFDIAAAETHDRLRARRSPWGARLFRALGLKSYSVSSTNAGEVLGQRFYDGDLDLHFSVPNKQLDVWNAGDSRLARTSLRDFVYTLHAEKLADLAAEQTGGGDIQYTADRAELIVNGETGFVRRATYAAGDGQVFSELLQFAPMRFTGGIVLPRLKMEFRYREGKLSSAEMILIDEAKINEPIRSDGFVIYLPPETTVVDRRKDTFRPETSRIKEATPNALAMVTGDGDLDNDPDNDAAAADLAPAEPALATAAVEGPAAALPVKVEPSERERLLQERVSVLRQKVKFVELLRRQGSGSPLDDSASRLELARAEAALAEERKDAEALQAALERAVSSAEESVDVARRQFRNAELSQVVVLDAENELLKARLAASKASTTQRQTNREQILQEHVETLKGKVERVEVLTRNAARGGGMHDVYLAKFELSKAEAALAEVQGDTAARNAALAKAVHQARNTARALQELNDVGRVTLETVLNAQDELLKARLAAAEAGVEIDADTGYDQ